MKQHREVRFPFSWDVMLLHWVMGSHCFKTMLSQYLRNRLPSDMASFLSYTAVKTLQSQTTLDIQLVLLEIESRGTKL
jgi:hypothetical protein